MRKSIVATLFLCLLFSCKGGKIEELLDFDDEEEVADSVEAFVGDTLHLFDEPEEPPVTVDELFDDFLYNFMEDAKFQGQRIAFPLPCRDGEEVEPLDKQEWAHHNRFHKLEFYSFIYEREQDFQLTKDTAARSVDVEWIDLQNERMEKFLFNRQEGRWMLTGVEKERNDNTPNGDFLKFYAKFVNDSIFQRESLAQPVRLILTSEDGEEEPQEEWLSPDDWSSMRGDLPLSAKQLVNIDYGQAIISQNRKTLLIEGASNGFMMKFTFDKRGDDWKLIEMEY